MSARLEEAKAEVADLEAELEIAEKVSAVFRSLIDQEITEGVKAVERLLTEGLQAVFDNQDLRVRAEIEVKRGKVSVDLITMQVLADGTVVEGSAVSSFGGSLVTVQSVLLRLIVMLRRNIRPFMLLDEALPAFDPVYVENMGKFLSSLCRKMDVDILMVTHNPALFDSADRAYRIQNDKGIATFTKV